MRKLVNATVIGRRNKQQILRDFIRPSASDVISSPAITIGDGAGNGNCIDFTGSGTVTSNCQGCSGGGSAPAAEGCTSYNNCPPGAWDRADAVTCVRDWTVSGSERLNSNQIYLSTQDPRYVDTTGVTDGQLSGTPLIFPAMDAIGSMENANIFGASYIHNLGRASRVISDCTPNTSESQSMIHGKLIVNGDYFSDPLVDYPVFAVSESSGYQTWLYININNIGNSKRLRYFASSRFLYGSLSYQRAGDPLTPGWIFDEWVLEDVSGDLWNLTPIGSNTNEIPFSFSNFRNEDGTRVQRMRIGNYVTDTTGINQFTPLDMWISMDRQVEWNKGTINDNHTQHFNAAYKGQYSPITVSVEAQHIFFVSPTEYSPIPSNTQTTVRLKRETTTEYWLYQDVSNVYNVMVDGLAIPPASWVHDGRYVRFNFDVDYDAIVVAEVLVS